MSESNQHSAKVKPVFVVGPPSSGKSHYIKELAQKERRTLLHCPCRKDRTLREQRAIIHEWALRAEPTLLWIEGTDDLTPEAQSFLRRILETYAPSVRFCLEAQSLESIQEPILSRCEIIRLNQPTSTVLKLEYGQRINNDTLNDIFTYTYSKTRRQLEAAIALASYFPATWAHIKTVHNSNKELSLDTPPIKLYTAAINPWHLIYDNFNKFSSKTKEDIVNCIINNGNPYSLIGYVQLRK
jgi:DNA polymerase III delta prime subunit